MIKERSGHLLSALLLLWVALLGTGFLGSPAQAAPRDTLTFQARVLTKDRLIAPSGRYSFRFTLYNQASGGTPVWQESWVGINEVVVRSGLFSVALGSITPLSSLDWSGNYYLVVEFDSDRNGSLEQLFGSRIPLAAAPYSLHTNLAETAKQLAGITTSSLLSRIANETVTGSWVFQNALRVNGTTTLSSSLNGVLTAESGVVGAEGRGNLTGTANQVNVAGGSGSVLGAGVTLSLPQDIGPASTVQFDKLGLGAAPGTARLTLATSTSSDGGISFGSDATLYRSGSGILRTDAALRAKSLQSWLDNGTIYTQDHLSGSSFLALRANPGKEMYLVWTEDTVADRWTMGIKPGDSKLYLGAGNPATNTNVLAIDSDGTLELPLATSASTGLILGTDTNLYRSAANTLRTDDALTVGGELTISHTSANSTGQSVMISSPAPVLAFDDINQTAPQGKLAIRAAGITDALLFMGRNSDDTAWNSLAYLYRQTGNFLLLNQADLLLGDADSSHSAGFQAPASLSSNLLWTLPSSDSAGCLSSNGSGSLSWAACSGDSGAPVDATYLTLSGNASLSGERILQGTTNQILLTDAGANGNLTLSLPQSIATSSSVQFGALGLGSVAGTSALVVQQAGSTDIAQFKDADSVRYIAINGSGQLGLYSSEASNSPLRSYVVGESAERFHISAAGGLSWGNGTDPIDTVLYRSAANTLATPDALSFYRSDNSTLGLQISAGSANNFLTASSGGIILLSASGVDIDSSTGFGVESLDGSTDYFRVNTSSGLITMPQATSSGSALVLGVDTDLYRSASAVLTTSSQFSTPTGAVLGLADTTALLPTQTGLFVAGDGEAKQIVSARYENSTNSPVWQSRKARGSYATPADVLNGDNLGSFSFYGYQNGDWRQSAALFSQVDTDPSGSVVQGNLIFQTADASGSMLTALKVDSGQKLWIGSAADTNLYRSTANTLKTDDNLIVEGDLTANTGATTLGATLISALAVSGNTSVAASINGMLKASSGLISAASGDVDYQQPITWGDGLSYSSGTASADYNATNLKITAAQINTIQDIATSSNVQFGSLGLGRVASNQTPLTIGGTITGTSYLFGTHVSPTMTSSGNHVYGVFIEPTASIADGTIYSGLALGASQSLTVASGTGEVRSIQITEPVLAAGTVDVNSGLYIGNQSIGTTNYGIYLQGTGLGNQISWQGDTNLYRSAADQLTTDDQLIAGSLSVGTNDSAALVNLKRTGGAGAIHLTSISDTGSDGSGLELMRKRSTSSLLQSGDRVGQIVFRGWDDGTYGAVQTALIQTFVDGTPGANDMPGRLVFSTTNDGGATPLEALRIDSSQKLWIGGSAGLDTNLYRSAANTLKTDDSLIVTGAITGNSKLNALNIGSLSGSDAGLSISGDLSAGNAYSTHLLLTATDANGNSRLAFGDYTTGAVGTVLQSARDAVEGGADFTIFTRQSSDQALAQAIRIDNDQKIWIGSTADTNLYRSAANTLKTDWRMEADSFKVNTNDTGDFIASRDDASATLVLRTLTDTSTTAPQINLVRRSGSNTAVSSGDALGKMAFVGRSSPGSDHTAVTILGEVDGTVSSGIVPGRLLLSTTNSAGTLREALRVDSAQKLWIGGGAGLDTNLYRSSANNLVTDDNFTASTLIANNYSVVNSGVGGAFILRNSADSANRWSIYRANNETGSNAGSDLFFYRYDDAGNSLGVPLSITRSTGAVNLAQATSASTGLVIGSDTNLYRSAAGKLSSDSIFSPNAIRISSTNPDPYIWDGAISTTNINGIIGVSLQPTISSDRDAGSINVSVYSKPSLAAGITASGTYSHLRVDNISLGSGASLATQYGLYINSLTSATTNAAIYLAGTGIGNGIIFGTDANLYRGAANELRTDDLLSFSSTKAGTDIDFKSYKTVNATNKVAFIFDTSSSITSGSLLSVRNNGVAKFTVTNAGNLISSGTLTQNGTPGDVAENIPVSDPSIKAGDIVSPDPLHPGQVKKATSSDKMIAGVISTEYAILLSGATAGKPLALTGRVPVRVSSENGLIKTGDVIVTSAQAGVGVRATSSSSTVMVGVALTDQAPGSSTVTVQLQPGYYTEATGSSSRTAALSPQQQGILNSFTLLEDGSLFTARLTVQRLTVTERLAVAGDLEVTGTAYIGGIALPDTQSGAATLASGEDRLFVPTAAVRSTDRILLTPRFDGSQAPNLSRGDVKEGEGFWVHRTSSTDLPATFDWLLIH